IYDHNQTESDILDNPQGPSYQIVSFDTTGNTDGATTSSGSSTGSSSSSSAGSTTQSSSSPAASTTDTTQGGGGSSNNTLVAALASVFSILGLAIVELADMEPSGREAPIVARSVPPKANSGRKRGGGDKSAPPPGQKPGTDFLVAQSLPAAAGVAAAASGGLRVDVDRQRNSSRSSRRESDGEGSRRSARGSGSSPKASVAAPRPSSKSPGRDQRSTPPDGGNLPVINDIYRVLRFSIVVNVVVIVNVLERRSFGHFVSTILAAGRA
ncbi:hypothetical protein HK405_003826, partial [Cladochytrium tenue]